MGKKRNGAGSSVKKGIGIGVGLVVGIGIIGAVGVGLAWWMLPRNGETAAFVATNRRQQDPSLYYRGYSTRTNLR